MKAITPRGRFCRLFAIGLLTGTVASAQTAPAASTSTAAATSTDTSDKEVLTLEQFDVTTEKSSGYRAANSATATGIGTRIMDIPLPINVLTKDFLEDTNITELREALEYVPGIQTTPRNESEYGVRGFTGNVSYRNGQYRRQNYTSWNMDRVEVMKGPAAVFFGSVRDGGVINYMTTKPQFTNRSTDLTFVVGSEDLYRVGVFQNLPLTKTVAARFGAGFLDSQGKGAYSYRRETYIGGSLLWRITPNQQLTIDAEEQHRNNYMMSSRGYAMTNSFFLYNPNIPVFQANGTPTTTRQGLNAIGLTNVPTYNMWAPIFPAPDVYGRYYGFSPDSYEKFISQAVDVDYLFKITKNLVWQTSLNWAFDDQPGLRSNNGDQEPMVDGRVRFRFQGFRNHRNSYNAKNKLTYRFDLGPTNHTLQAGFDYQEVVTRRPGTLINNTFNSSLVSDFKIFNPKTDSPVSGFAEMAATPGQVYVMWSKQHEYNRGTYIVNQSHFFKDRLHLLYGIRQNKLRNSTTVYDRPVTNSPGDSRPRPSGWTPQTGILFQPIPDLSLFVVRSQTIEPQFQVDADGKTADPRETEGIDFGFKTAFLDGRVSSTVTYYTLEKTNLTARDTAKELLTGLTPYYIYGNAQTSRGIEADLNLSVLDNLQMVVGWSHIFYAKVTASTDPTRIGRALGWTPLDKVTVWTRYQLKTGPEHIKGMAFGLGANYTAGARINGDPNIALRTEPYTVFDFMASQNFKLRDRQIKAQINVKNLADKDYRTGSLGMWGQERSYTLTLSTRL